MVFRVYMVRFHSFKNIKKKLNESKQNDGDGPSTISYVKQNLLHANWHVYTNGFFYYSSSICSQWPFEIKNKK